MSTKPTEMSNELKTKCIEAVFNVLGYDAKNPKEYVTAVHMTYTYVNETKVTDMGDIEELIRLRFL